MGGVGWGVRAEANSWTGTLRFSVYLRMQVLFMECALWTR